MNTIGQLLRKKRLRKKLSPEEVEKETKIKKAFIIAIEKSDWDNLPEYPVVGGFVKNLANYFGIDPDKATAILRRDYPPKTLPVNPKPDVSKEFVWSPKLTFLLGVALILLIIFGYLSFQYVKFTSPPTLSVSAPKENQEVTQDTILVEGKTDTDATIKVNNQPVIVDDDGNFSVDLEISKETNEIVIIATSRSGKTTEVKKKIIPKIEE